MSEARVLVDDAAPHVRRLTLNRPDKRNAIDNAMRGQLLGALQDADGDPEVRVTIVRGAGRCFSSGYDLRSDLSAERPYFTAELGLPWARHVSEGWMSLWDLAKPVIAQVHGYALAGGLELVGACDLAYAASDARFGHPVMKIAGLPDFPWFPVKLAPRHAMELHLTGREYDGEEAASVGLINRAFAPDQLEAQVLAIATRMAETSSEVLAVHKRYVHGALEARGARAIVRTGNDLQAGPHMQKLMSGGAAAGEDILEQVKGKAK